MRNERWKITIKPGGLIGTESAGLINRVSRKPVNGWRWTVSGYRLTAVIDTVNLTPTTEHLNYERR